MDPAELTAHVVALSQKVEALSQGFQDLQTENQALRMNLAALQTASSRDDPEPTVCPPECFSGDRKKYRRFINSCQILFDLKPRTYRTDRVKIRTIISYLRDEPQDWAHTLLEREDPALDSLGSFIGAMNNLYEDSSKRLTAVAAIRSLKQERRPVEEYLTEFKRWAAETEWNDLGLCDQFRLGLSEALKDELAKVELPDSLHQLMKVCTSLDRRLRERRSERSLSDRPCQGALGASRERSTPPSTSSTVPMEIGALRGPLTQTEKQRRRTSNLCLYCASPAHLVEQCPHINKKPAGEKTTIISQLTKIKTPTSHILISLILQWDQSQLTIEAMLDSGASGNFIDLQIVMKNKIPTCYKTRPQVVNVIDGSPLHTGPITQETIPLLAVSAGNHIEHIVFDLIPSPHFPVILGLPWLRQHQPEINWERLAVSFSSPYCRETCLRPLYVSLLQTEKDPGTPQIPQPYLDFSDVFNTKNAERLPPHRTCDCPIDLIPNSKIPVGRLYPLSPPEL